MNRGRAGVVCVTVCLFFSFSGSVAVAGHLLSDDYALEVSKSRRILLLKRGLQVEKRYPISTGSGGRGDKERVGDHKTPIGTYRIVKVKAPSQFHTFFQLSYPNVKDAFYGLRDKLISLHDFDRIVFAQRHRLIPPQDTRLGGAIGIHGIGPVTPQKMKIHWSTDWTRGCIALTNGQIDELRKLVGVGTTVVINE